MKNLKQIQAKRKQIKEICSALKLLGKQEQIKNKNFVIDCSDIFAYVRKKKIVPFDQLALLEKMVLKFANAEECLIFLQITPLSPEQKQPLLDKLCQSQNIYLLDKLYRDLQKAEQGFNQYGIKLCLTDSQKLMLERAIEQAEQKNK